MLDIYIYQAYMLYSFWGGDHVTMIGHARAGMGYQNEFQAENYGLLTIQILFLKWVCSFLHEER
jgi:hypothetical protein